MPMDLVERISAKKLSRGFSIAEVLLAMAVLGFVSLTVVKIMTTLDKGSRRERVLTTMIALETALNTALESPETYAPYKAALVARTLDSFSVNFLGEHLVSFNGSAPGVNFFDLNGDPCASGGGNCLVKIEFFIRKDQLPQYEINYRISSNYSGTNETPLSSLGIQDNISLTTASSGNIIPEDFYADGTNSNCRPVGSNNNLLLKGVNNSTGEVTCWSRPVATDVCKNGEVPIGVYADQGPSGDRFRVKCQTANTVKCLGGPDTDMCPASMYALSKLNKDFIHNPKEGDTVGECVYQGAAIVEAKNAGSTDAYCPRYRAKSAYAPDASDRTKCKLACPQTTKAVTSNKIPSWSRSP